MSAWTERALALPLAEQKLFVLDSLEKMKANDPGFWTLLRSRIAFSGRKVVGYMGERSGGILSCWPRNLDTSLDLLYSLRKRITVMEDAFDALEVTDNEDSYTFVDPPFTFTKPRPGYETYDEITVDHPKLLAKLRVRKGVWQLTYNISPSTRKATANMPGVKSYFAQMTGGGGRCGGTKKWELLVNKS